MSRLIVAADEIAARAEDVDRGGRWWPNDDLIVKALPAILEALAAETHIVRCVGCGSWAWDDRNCGTCTTLTRRRQRRAARLPRIRGRTRHPY